MEDSGTNELVEHGGPKWKTILKNTLLILAALLAFLFALDLMITSFQQLGKAAAETILLATSNPFTALFIGLLITAIIQSSSATTSMVVALVASGSLTLEGAIPIIMGANVGTTITSTIVSLGFIAKKKEFIRAVAAGTYHDFFNILTVLILFPFEYFYGLLSGLSHQIAVSFFNEPINIVSPQQSMFGDGFTPLTKFLITNIDSGLLLAILSFALLFGSILFFRRIITNLLGIGSENTFQKFFFKSPLKSFGWGLVTTAAIRSSTITTSLVVPLVAHKVVKLREAAPFILGANIGTTVTAFIAAAFNSNSAISIAIAHLMFNVVGTLIFLIIPFFKTIPLKLATRFGQLTRKYRLVGFLYILVVFFFLPFSLIYIHRDQSKYQEAVYEKRSLETGKREWYSVIIQEARRMTEYTWIIYGDTTRKSEPTKIQSVLKRKNVMLIENELFEFNRVGYCRSNELNGRPYQLCIEEILGSFEVGGQQYDSVFVFSKSPVQYEQRDSTTVRVFVCKEKSLFLKRERLDKKGALFETEQLTTLNDK
ncbi:MAG: Na/Pi symporter [Cyclobacteriaceae bacterium]